MSYKSWRSHGKNCVNSALNSSRSTAHATTSSTASRSMICSTSQVYLIKQSAWQSFVAGAIITPKTIVKNWFTNMQKLVVSSATTLPIIQRTSLRRCEKTGLSTSTKIIKLWINVCAAKSQCPMLCCSSTETTCATTSEEPKTAKIRLLDWKQGSEWI